MASQTQYLDEKRPRKASKSPARSSKPNGKSKSNRLGYTSDGVEDHDIFSLPTSDWQVLALITVLGSFVRLFRIYQPTSVVFDEVQ
jgi:dolichyl-phosphate-mannose-protein mannosyltransferase